MDSNICNRRSFLKTAAMATAFTGVAGKFVFGAPTQTPGTNPLPRWRGFNLLDYFNPLPPKGDSPNQTTEEDFRWMADWGFDFVRIPMAYPRYLNFDPSKNITPGEMLNFNEKVINEVEQLVDLANKYKLHVSLNLHRAPGYCINAGFNEPYNLWLDEAAQHDFYAHWEMWAKRFKNRSREQISFDLVNEPTMREDMNDQFDKRTSVPGDIYRKVALNAVAAIHKHNPDRLVVADGNDGGSSAIPEITDLPIAQSCRGYYPHYISHYRAPWVFKDPNTAPLPVWPGRIDGQDFSRTSLEKFYQPWIDLVKKGVGVHCGECGCWRDTPHEVFLAWFGDVLDILTENGIGYALWNFRGDFGILDSGRKDIAYEDWHGHQLDRKMLELLQKH